MTSHKLLRDRLDALPPKTAVPFRDLLDKGFITDESLSTILDAGELAENPSKLLGFAIGYMNLRQSGVPMTDVIKMSRELGRTIRLDWSINRWRSEHDRLSRAVALKRLAEDNTTYDVEKYEKALPPRFPGYLIRTSRRLGMEGLRQRHCVASYHRQLERAYSALAVVFVNKKRWTVQLHTTPNPDVPLRISQIRTRLNATPTANERSEIYRVLGVDDSPRPSRASNASNERHYPYLDNLRRLLPVLREHGVDYVGVTFEGGGDDGQIDSVRYDPGTFDGDAINLRYLQINQQFEDGDWLYTLDECDGSVTQAITELTDDYLNSLHVDISNGDGGWAELLIDVDAGTVDMDVNSRFTDSTQLHKAVNDIETGDVID